MTFFEVCGLIGLKSGEHYKYNSQSGEIEFSNGSLVILKDLFTYPSDPNFDSLGSLEITFAFIDECNQIDYKAYQIVTSRIRYKLDFFGIKPKILMSCNPAKNWVYSEFYRPFKDGVIKHYRRFIQALAMDNAFLSPHYVENLQKLDENSKQRLLYGNWEYDDDPTKLFEYKAILAMWTNAHVPRGSKYITVDVARLGGDYIVIFVWDGWRIVEARRFKVEKLNYTDTEIKRLANKHGVMMHNIIVDEDGVGGGLVDFGGYTGFVNGSSCVGEGNYANLKSQCSFEIAKKVNAGEIAVDFDDPEIKAILIEDLEQIKDWNSDKDDQKIRVIPKDEIKKVLGRSPDCYDALMMRYYFELFPPARTFKIKGLM
jgi:hypothetical protein